MLGHGATIMVSADECEDLHDVNDFKYRTLLAFLPRAGVSTLQRTGAETWEVLRVPILLET